MAKGKVPKKGGHANNPMWFKGMTSANPNGEPSKKEFSDALRLILKREVTDDDGDTRTKLYMIANRVVNMALDGNLAAVHYITDRTDGPVNRVTEPDNNAPHRDDHGLTEQEIRDQNAQFVANLMMEVKHSQKQKNKMN